MFCGFFILNIKDKRKNREKYINDIFSYLLDVKI